jgi:hypothetical protein
VKVDIATRRLGRNKRTAVYPPSAHGPQSYEIRVEPFGSHSCCGSAAGPCVHHGGKNRDAGSRSGTNGQGDPEYSALAGQFIPPPDARPAGKDRNGHEFVSHHLGAAAYEKLRPTRQYPGQIRKTYVDSQSRLTSAPLRDGSPLIMRDFIECEFVATLKEEAVVTALAPILYRIYTYSTSNLALAASVRYRTYYYSTVDGLAEAGHEYIPRPGQ